MLVVRRGFDSLAAPASHRANVQRYASFPSRAELSELCLFCSPHRNDKMLLNGRNDAGRNVQDCRNHVGLHSGSAACHV